MLRVPWKSASAEETPTTETPPDLEPSGRPRLARWLLALVVLIALGIAGFFAYRQFLAPKPTAPTVQTFPVRAGNIVSTVAATGTVANQNVSRLSFPTSGSSGGTSVVTALKVNVGDSVTKGQVLATLDSTSLQLAVTEAQATLASAQSKLATIQAGPLASDVASAQAAVTNAQANLDSVKAGALPSDISAAQQTVASAQGQVASARSSLAKLKAGPTAQDVSNARIQILQAKNNLRQAQDSQNSTCAFTATTKVPTEPQSQIDACTKAKLSTTNAGYGVTTAQNNYNKLFVSATAADLAAAKASVTAAENSYNGAVAKLNALKAGPTDAQLASAQAQLTSAQASLYKVENPYTDADIQSAQATVAQAQAGLDTAQANLDTATLKAPFDGVVSAVAINVGEAPASPAITVIDPNNLLLNTTVDESDISKVKVGQTVSLTFDAIPNEAFQGKVTSIAPTATIQSGVALYTVQININSTPVSFPNAANGATGATAGTGFTRSPGATAGTGANRAASGTPGANANPGASTTPSASAAPSQTALKAGMTGNATIVYGDVTSVLVVPNSAVKSQGRNHVVDVMVNGKSETKNVTIGASNDTLTEITNGLAEGDQVVVNSTTTTTSSTAGRVPGGAILGGGIGGGGPVQVQQIQKGD